MPPRIPTDILAAAAAIAAGTAAYGQPVRFDNVGIGFVWKNAFLDITRSADEQGEFNHASSALQAYEWEQTCYYYNCQWISEIRVSDGALLLANEAGYLGEPLVISDKIGAVFDDARFAESKLHPYFQAIDCDDHGKCFSNSYIGSYQYVPARFEVDGETHFGWVQVKFGQPRENIDALAWGYERTPGVSIAAGAGDSAAFCEGETIQDPADAQEDGFGQALAAGQLGLAIGAFRADSAGIDSGAAYVCDPRTGGVSKLPTPAGLAAGDFFGASAAFVGYDQDILAVGAPRHDAPQNNSGAVYLFRQEGGMWVQSAQLTAPDGAASDQFGLAVSADGDVLLVGAPRADIDGLADAGAVYEFRRTGDDLAFETKTTAPTPIAGARFGASIAATSEPISKNSPDFPPITLFAVGAPFEGTDIGAEAGVVYAYWITNYPPELISRSTSGSAQPGGHFGASLSGSNLGPFADRLLVGAPGEDGGAAGSGAAYMLESIWFPLQTRIVPAQPVENGEFGSSVSVYGLWAAVGSRGGNGQTPASGSATVYHMRDDTWVAYSDVVPQGGQTGDAFGHSVVVGPGYIAGGSLYADGPGGKDEGSVTVFSLCAGLPCYGDLDKSTGPGNLDLFDFLAFVNLFNSADPRADCDKSGVFDLFDFLCFTNAFNEGCP